MGLVSLIVGPSHGDFLATAYQVWRPEVGNPVENSYVVGLRKATGFDSLMVYVAHETQRWVLVRVVKGTPQDPRIVHVLQSWALDEAPPTYDSLRRSLENPRTLARRQQKAIRETEARKQELRLARVERCRELGKLLVKRGADPNHPETAKWLRGAYEVPVTEAEMAQVEEQRARTYGGRKPTIIVP